MCVANLDAQTVMSWFGVNPCELWHVQTEHGSSYLATVYNYIYNIHTIIGLRQHAQKQQDTFLQ